MTLYIGKLFIVSAASGVGKTSLVQQIINKIDNIVLSISHTTRPKRPKEQDGVDYFFIDQKTFLQMKNNQEFLENAEVFGNYYGTSKKFVIDSINQGKDVILEIDYQGTNQIKNHPIFSFFSNQEKSKIDCLSIFILPPSLQTLTNRLTSRGQDTPFVIQQRLNNEKKEMGHYIDYDFLVINDNFNHAAEELTAIINVQRLTLVRQQVVHASLINSLLV